MKLRRANELYKTLAEDVATFYSEQPFRFRVWRNDSDYVFTIHDLKPPPPRWGMQTGDIVHNARTALDHLAFSLALSNGHTPRRARRGSFPIVPGDKQAFDDSGAVKAMRKLLRPADQERIEHLQMFNSDNRSVWPWLDGLGNAGTPGRLRLLSYLDNVDKHETLRIVGHAVGDARYEPPVPRPYTASHVTNLGLLAEGDSFARWQFEGVHPPLDVLERIPPAEIHATYPIAPRLEEPGPIGGVFFDDWELLTTLRRCLATAQSVLRIFEPSLLRGQPPMQLSDALQPDPADRGKPSTATFTFSDE